MNTVHDVLFRRNTLPLSNTPLLDPRRTLLRAEAYALRRSWSPLLSLALDHALLAFESATASGGVS